MRNQTQQRVLNANLSWQFTVCEILLEGGGNFPSTFQHEVAVFTKMKFGPFEGRSRKSELSRRPADSGYDLIINRPKFLSEEPKHDSDFCMARFSPEGMPIWM